MHYNKKVIALSLLVISGCIIFSGYVVSTLRSVAVPAESIISAIKTSVHELGQYFRSVDYYKTQNESLRLELNRIKAQYKAVQEYEDEVHRLERLLELENDVNNNFSSTAARVVSFCCDGWNNTLKINKGYEHGVSVGDGVISAEGLLGKVVETGKAYSLIATIISCESSVSVRIIRNSQPAIVVGDVELCKENLCKLSIISDTDVVNIGDVLETTGDGGLYPEGVLVGEVERVFFENSQVYARVKPSIDFSKLNEVLVLKRK